MPYAIQIVPSALEELKTIEVFQRRRIVQVIDDQLTQQPTAVTRNRKPLPDLRPGFECEPPIWELRIGGYRVFYDVAADSQTVYIRAVREKPPHAQTEDIV
jgi:mRNA-degrading endonuclease RelE of RelBE toxin-antitoxin system